MKLYAGNWSQVGRPGTPFRRGALTRPVHQGPMTAPAVFTLKFSGTCAACAARIPEQTEAVGFKPDGAPRFIIWHNTQPCIDKMTAKGLYGTDAGGVPKVPVPAGPDPWLAAYDEQE